MDRAFAVADPTAVLLAVTLLAADLARFLGEVFANVGGPSSEPSSSSLSSGRLRFLLLEFIDDLDAVCVACVELTAALPFRDREDDAFRIVAVPFGGGTIRSSLADGTSL